MNGHPNEPLTPQERDLAERLARLGPHDGPSPAMDASILAAAREAVERAPRAAPRRRWRGLSGGAGGLVTGLGFAASLTLVLGVVWQMRPMETSYRSEPAGDAAEHVIMVETVPGSRAPGRSVAPPPPDAVPTPAAPAPAAPDTPSRGIPAPTARSPRTSAPGAPPEADRARGVPAAASARQDASRAAEAEALADVEEARAAEMERHQAAASEAMQAKAGAPTVDDTPATASRRATYTRAARATPERAERLDRAPRPVGAAPAFAPDPAAMSGAAEAAAPAQDIADAAPGVLAEPGDPLGLPAPALRSLPVEADARLEPADWLQRIRARKVAGDTQAARESLARFRDAHPDVAVPDDLEALRLPATPAP